MSSTVVSAIDAIHNALTMEDMLTLQLNHGCLLEKMRQGDDGYNEKTMKE
jgi:hypothetical protein